MYTVHCVCESATVCCPAFTAFCCLNASVRRALTHTRPQHATPNDEWSRRFQRFVIHLQTQSHTKKSIYFFFRFVCGCVTCMRMWDIERMNNIRPPEQMQLVKHKLSSFDLNGSILEIRAFSVIKLNSGIILWINVGRHSRHNQCVGKRWPSAHLNSYQQLAQSILNVALISNGSKI